MQQAARRRMTYSQVATGGVVDASEQELDLLGAHGLANSRLLVVRHSSGWRGSIWSGARISANSPERLVPIAEGANSARSKRCDGSLTCVEENLDICMTVERRGEIRIVRG